MDALIIIGACILALALCLLGDYLDAKRHDYWLKVRTRIGL